MHDLKNEDRIHSTFVNVIPVADDPPPDYTLLTPPPPYTVSMEEEYQGRYQNIDNPFSFQTSNQDDEKLANR